MPILAAASKIVVPGSTSTFRPSIVTSSNLGFSDAAVDEDDADDLLPEVEVFLVDWYLSRTIQDEGAARMQPLVEGVLVDKILVGTLSNRNMLKCDVVAKVLHLKDESKLIFGQQNTGRKHKRPGPGDTD